MNKIESKIIEGKIKPMLSKLIPLIQTYIFLG